VKLNGDLRAIRMLDRHIYALDEPPSDNYPVVPTHKKAAKHTSAYDDKKHRRCAHPDVWAPSLCCKHCANWPSTPNVNEEGADLRLCSIDQIIRSGATKCDKPESFVMCGSIFKSQSEMKQEEVCGKCGRYQMNRMGTAWVCSFDGEPHHFQDVCPHEDEFVHGDATSRTAGDGCECKELKSVGLDPSFIPLNATKFEEWFQLVAMANMVIEQLVRVDDKLLKTAREMPGFSAKAIVEERQRQAILRMWQRWGRCALPDGR